MQLTITANRHNFIGLSIFSPLFHPFHFRTSSLIVTLVRKCCTWAGQLSERHMTCMYRNSDLESWQPSAVVLCNDVVFVNTGVYQVCDGACLASVERPTSSATVTQSHTLPTSPSSQSHNCQCTSDNLMSCDDDVPYSTPNSHSLKVLLKSPFSTLSEKKYSPIQSCDD